MKANFWGAQGSLPSSYNAQANREKIFRALQLSVGKDLSTDEQINRFIDDELPFSVSGTYGTNTTCVQIIGKETDEYIICDCGSGMRDFGLSLARSGATKKPATYHIFITHLHWDHLQGFPFFAPAYIPNSKIIFHTYHEKTEESFRMQMREPCFPVPFNALAADISFEVSPPCTRYSIGGIEITSILQNHPGKSYGYRFESEGKAIVFSTDSEHKQDAEEDGYPFIDFFKNADLVIFDAQYTMADAHFTKINWGHSNNVMGVELASRAKVKTLALFHHEPTNSDAQLEEFLFNTRMYNNIYQQEAPRRSRNDNYPKEIILAYDGLVLEV